MNTGLWDSWIWWTSPPGSSLNKMSCRKPCALKLLKQAQREFTGLLDAQHPREPRYGRYRRRQWPAINLSRYRESLNSCSKTQGVLGLRRRANGEKKMKVSSCKGCLRHCGENYLALLGLKPSRLLQFLIPQPFLIHRSPKPSVFHANVMLCYPPPGCAEQCSV